MNSTSSPTSRPDRLTRSTADKKLTGVAGGLARYFDVDPLLVRVGFAVSLLFSGVGAIVYLTLLALLPTDTPRRRRPPLAARAARRFACRPGLRLGRGDATSSARRSPARGRVRRGDVPRPGPASVGVCTGPAQRSRAFGPGRAPDTHVTYRHSAREASVRVTLERTQPHPVPVREPRRASPSVRGPGDGCPGAPVQRGRGLTCDGRIIARAAEIGPRLPPACAARTRAGQDRERRSSLDAL